AGAAGSGQMNDDVELSESEREALAGAKRPMAAPPAVENAIIAQLRSRGLLASRRARPLRWLTMAAALVAAFVGGAAFQRTAAAPGAQGPRFLLLLYGGDSAAPGRRGEYG